MNANTGHKFDFVMADTSDIMSNSWLAGFIDADGSFDIRVREKVDGSAKDRVESRFRLEQRMKDPITGDWSCAYTYDHGIRCSTGDNYSSQSRILLD